MNKEKLEAEARKIGWALNLAEKNGDIDRFISKDVRYLIECINKLDEPVKPVIPQFVADWIEECKEVKHNLYGVLDFAPTDVEEWLFHTPEKSEMVDLIARAWLYGYEVEKEPQWVVVRNCMYIKNLYFGEMNDDYRVGSIAYKEQAMVFTDKAKAEAVALLVDGEVEELEE